MERDSVHMDLVIICDNLPYASRVRQAVGKFVEQHPLIKVIERKQLLGKMDNQQMQHKLQQFVEQTARAEARRMGFIAPKRKTGKSELMAAAICKTDATGRFKIPSEVLNCFPGAGACHLTIGHTHRNRGFCEVAPDSKGCYRIDKVLRQSMGISPKSNRFRVAARIWGIQIQACDIKH